jgi:hypothetical protein
LCLFLSLRLEELSGSPPPAAYPTVRSLLWWWLATADTDFSDSEWFYSSYFHF